MNKCAITEHGDRRLRKCDIIQSDLISRLRDVDCHWHEIDSCKDSQVVTKILHQFKKQRKAWSEISQLDVVVTNPI